MNGNKALQIRLSPSEWWAISHHLDPDFPEQVLSDKARRILLDHVKKTKKVRPKDAPKNPICKPWPVVD